MEDAVAQEANLLRVRIPSGAPFSTINIFMLPQPKLDILFPKHVYRIEGLFLEQLPDFENTCRDIIDVSGTVREGEWQVQTTNQTNNQVLNDPRLDNLRATILEYAREFMREMNYHEDYINNSDFVDSFTNLSFKGDHLYPHTHGLCLVAGVFYIKAPAGAQVWFFDDIPKIERHYKSSCPSTAHESYAYDCIPGTLLLFKSDLAHGNKSQPEGDKVVISFKIM